MVVGIVSESEYGVTVTGPAPPSGSAPMIATPFGNDAPAPVCTAIVTVWPGTTVVPVVGDVIWSSGVP